MLHALTGRYSPRRRSAAGLKRRTSDTADGVDRSADPVCSAAAASICGGTNESRHQGRTPHSLTAPALIDPRAYPGGGGGLSHDCDSADRP